MSKILISSCLLGLNTRYDGKNKLNEKLVELARNKQIVFVCPEQLSGLSTPREPAEIEAGKSSKDVLEGNARVITISGNTQTKEFLIGAQKTLDLCKSLDIKVAILKENSPSCASNNVYDGTFKGGKIPGTGVVAELLKQNGITVYNEDNYPLSLFDSTKQI